MWAAVPKRTLALWRGPKGERSRGDPVLEEKTLSGEAVRVAGTISEGGLGLCHRFDSQTYVPRGAQGGTVSSPQAGNLIN